jgi:hypothetical protein
MSEYSSAIQNYLLGSRSQIASSVDADPDEAARAVDLSNATGIPTGLITADQETFDREYRQHSTMYLVMNNPKLIDYVNSHPLAAAVSNDDWGNLSQLSDRMGRTASAIASAAVAGFGPSPISGEEYARTSQVWGLFTPLVAGVVQAGALVPRAFGAAAGAGAEALEQAGVLPLLDRLSGRVRSPEARKAEAEEFLGVAPMLSGMVPEATGAAMARDLSAAAKARINSGLVGALEGDLEAAEGSATRARSPELFRKFVEQHFGDQTLSVGGDAVVRLYGDRAPSPDDGVLGWAPGIAGKLEVARATGADIEIPVADWLTHVDPKIAQKLEDDIRVWPGGVTASEAREPAGGAVVDSPLAQVRAATETEPTFAVGDRKLTLVPEEGGFQVLGPRGEPVGSVPVPADGPIRIPLPVEVGPSSAVDIERQIRALYPGRPVSVGAAVSGEPSIWPRLDQLTPAVVGLDARSKALLDRLIAERYDRDIEASRVRATALERRRQSQEWAENRARERAEVEAEFRGRPEVATNLLLERGEMLREADLTPEQRGALRMEPPRPLDTIRVYHGSDSDKPRSGWVTTDRRYAENYYGKGTKVFYTDLKKGSPEEIKLRNWDEIDEATGSTMVGTYRHDVIPELVNKLKPLEPEEPPRMSEDGIPVDTLADHFGAPSGEALIDRLIAYRAERTGMGAEEALRAAVEAETDRRMETKYGDLGARIFEAAKDRALSENELDLLAEEFKALGDRVIDPAAAKDWAQLAIGSEPIGSLRSDKFLRAMAKAGREAERALIAGDHAKALVAMQRKYLSGLMAAEARRVEGELRSADRLIDRLGAWKRGDKWIAPDYLNWAHQILLAIGKPVRNRSVQGIAEDIAARGKTFEEFVAEKEGELRELPIWDQLFQKGWRKPYQSLSVDDFRALYGSLRALDHNGRDELKIARAGAKADLDEIKAQMLAALEKFPIKGSGDGVVGRALRRYGAHHLIVETLLNRWDQYDPMGPWSQWVVRPLVEGANAEDALKKEFGARLRALGDRAPLDRTVSAGPWRDPDTGAPLRMTRAKLRTVLLNAGNSAGPQSNLWKLARGYGLEPEEVMGWLRQHATKADWDFAQGVWDLFADLKARSDEMYRSLSGGVAPDQVRVDPIATPFGEYRGGYYPVIFHPEFEGPVRAGALEEPGYVRASPPAGYTKTRTGVAAPLALDLDALPGRIAGVIHDLAMRPALINASKVLMDRDIRSAVRARAGTEVRDLLTPWLRDIANNAPAGSRAQSDFARWSEFFRQNMVSTLVGLNPGTVMKHGPTAWVQSMGEVGPARFLRAVRGMFSTGEGERNWAFAIRNSLELQRRERNYAETLAGGTQPLVPGGRFGSLRQTVIELGAKPVAFSDMLSAVPTWLAAYEKAIEDGASEGDARYLGDRAVRRAHGSASIVNRPAIMREWSPWFTSVYSFFNHILNRQAELLWQAGETAGLVGKGQFGAAMAKIPGLAGQLFAYVLFPAMVEEAVSPLTTSDQESWGVKAGKALAGTLASSWVGVRDIAHFLLSGQEPAVGLLTTAYGTVRRVAQDVEKGPSPKLLQDGAALAGTLTGLVPEQVGRTARFLAGEERPKGPWGFLVGLRYGTLKGHASTFENWMQGRNW